MFPAASASRQLKHESVLHGLVNLVLQQLQSSSESQLGYPRQAYWSHLQLNPQNSHPIHQLHCHHQSNIPWIASIQNILTDLHDAARLELRLEPIPALTQPFLSLLSRHTAASGYGGEVLVVFEGRDLSCFKLIRSLLL